MILPGVLMLMGSQEIVHDVSSELLKNKKKKEKKSAKGSIRSLKSCIVCAPTLSLL